MIQYACGPARVRSDLNSPPSWRISERRGRARGSAGIFWVEATPTRAPGRRRRNGPRAHRNQGVWANFELESTPKSPAVPLRAVSRLQPFHWGDLWSPKIRAQIVTAFLRSLHVCVPLAPPRVPRMGPPVPRRLSAEALALHNAAHGVSLSEPRSEEGEPVISGFLCSRRLLAGRRGDRAYASADTTRTNGV